jgi:hypothetical protein
LEEVSKKNEKAKELLAKWQEKGYLEQETYRVLLELKLSIKGESREAEVAKLPEISFQHKVVKIPCPHCSFLCSPKIQFCLKCGEPLPQLEKFDKVDELSDVSDVDYIERNIIHTLEKLTNKVIPLTETFNVNTTCYVKEGEEITGLSLFKCGLKKFPREILRLKSLKNLALRRNNIGVLPKDIGFFSNLEYLDLRINELESLPNAIGLLMKLKNLNLSSNRLMTISDSIGELLMLKKLNLSNNRLREIPECILNLNCLEILNLKANLWIQMPESIEKLKQQGLKVIL